MTSDTCKSPRERVLIAIELVAAYIATDFHVSFPLGEVILSIGHIPLSIGHIPRASPTFDQHQRIAIVTAYNPFSRDTEDRINQERQKELIAAIEGAGLRWAPAAGIDASGAWPPEPSLAVFDATDAQLDQWMVRFEQNAVVRATLDAPAELRFHPRAQLQGSNLVSALE